MERLKKLVDSVVGTGTTSTEEHHKHTYRVDKYGMGFTMYTLPKEHLHHVHKIVKFVVEDTGHSHSIKED